MRKFFDTIDKYWWIGLPAATGFCLAHFVDFTADWATILYWSLFGTMFVNMLAVLVVMFVNRNIDRKDLVRHDFWYPWQYVVLICITFNWMPDNNIVKALMICYLASFTGAWIENWKQYFLNLRHPKGSVPGRGRAE